MSATYAKVRALGSGTIATVYEGRDEKLGRPVAIKELSPKLAGSSEFVDIFLSEARRLGAISHPNIVQTYAVEEDNEPPWIISELADGSLAAEIQSGPATPEHVADVLRQILLGLTEVHNQGFVHRNIKPSNVLRMGSVYKLGDFGVEATDATIPYSTPRYISPEALSDPSKISPAADLYSLGTVMYELVLGESRFLEIVQRAADASGADDQLWFQFHMSQAELPALHDVDANIPEDLSSVLQNMVRKNPEERFATCADVLVNLDGIIQAGSKKRGRNSGGGLPLAAKVAIGVGGALTALLVAMILFGGGSRVDIVSEPSGATVVVDGEVEGRTPVEGVSLAVGTEVVVRKSGYIEQTVVLQEGDESGELGIELVPRTVELTSTPDGAAVMVDGTEVGVTPFTLEAVVDDTSIVVSSPGFVQQSVTIGPDDEAIRVELERAASAEPADPASLLEALWSRVDNTADFSIQLLATGMSGNRLPVGVPISFEIFSGAARYLAVFTLGQDGTLVCMYPNQVHSEIVIGAGETVTLPSDSDRIAGFSLETDVPYGTDRVFALASQAPLSSLPLTATSTPWLAAYPFIQGPGGVPALAFYRWIIDRLDVESGMAVLAAFEMEIVP